MNKTVCSAQVVGHISDKTLRGSDFPTSVSVEYYVNDKLYAITETIKYERKAVKIGAIPIGQKRVPKIGSIRIDSPTLVAYNPNNPQEAYLVENEGCDNMSITPRPKTGA